MFKKFKIFGIPVIAVALIAVVGYVAMTMFGGKAKEKIDSMLGKGNGA